MIKNKIILILGLLLVLTPLVHALIGNDIIWSNETSTDLIIESLKPSCTEGLDISDTGWWGWDATNSSFGFSESFYDCYREEVDYGSHGCCPIDYVCNTEDNQCDVSDSQLCAQYLTENQCSVYSSKVAETDVELNVGTEDYCDNVVYYTQNSLDDCYKAISCECYWDETGGPDGTGQCDSRDVTNDSCGPDGTCARHTTINEKCDETGFIETTSTATWIGTGDRPDTCPAQSPPSSIKCLSTALLPLIGTIAIIIVIVLIILYYILRNRKKSRKKKKR